MPKFSFAHACKFQFTTFVPGSVERAGLAGMIWQALFFLLMNAHPRPLQLSHRATAMSLRGNKFVPGEYRRKKSNFGRRVAIAQELPN